jgi:hydrogenase expression/formation protein HypE
VTHGPSVDSPAADSAAREARVLDKIAAYRQRRPRLTETKVTLAHGAGGKATAALIDAVFVDAFANDLLAPMADAAVGPVPAGHHVAFTTDAYVVTPRRFPGASIGHLAVDGTVNDLAVMGARPAWLTAAFIIEEGLAIDELREVAADMAEAAATAGVAIVAGDTKVVPRGAADGLYITTAGVGFVPDDCRLDAASVVAGDQVIVSGSIGDHGIAVLVARGDLAIDVDIRSDAAPLQDLVATLLTAAPGTRWLRDPTRGGLATVCNELAAATELGIVLREADIVIHPGVRAAGELLGIDPLHVANEGKLVAVVPAEETAAALAALRAHPLGAEASVVGEVVADPPRLVVLETAFGGTRVVDVLVGDPLPRIC